MTEPEDDDLLPEKGRAPEVPHFYEFFVDWWRDATGQTAEWHLHTSRVRAVARRIALWLPVVAIVALLAGAAGMYTFTGWRARDLARRSGAAIDEGELRHALIQAESARKLRGNDPVVLRAYAAALAASGDRRSLDIWRLIAAAGPLSEDDRVARAQVAVRMGDDAEFEDAVAVMQETGRTAEAKAWRGRRALEQRDFTSAQRFLQQAAAEDPSDERRFELAEMLANIGTKGALAGAVQIVEAAAKGEQPEKALAFGLSSVPAGPATRLGWAQRAWMNMRPDNAALLPAATVLVEDHHRAADEVVAELAMVFTGAGAEQRGAYARWLLDHNFPQEALVFARAGEARTSQGTFLVRAEALSKTRDWGALLELVRAGAPVKEYIAELLRARAEQGMGRTVAAEQSWTRAVRASAAAGRLHEVLAQVDAAGRPDVADRALLELCGSHAYSDYALRVARWRFSLRGEPRLREEAFKAALEASPRAPTVLDLDRLRRLMAGENVDPSETLAALEAESSNIDLRLTHALALTRNGRAAEARKVLEPCEAIRHQLQPGQKAVITAVLAATGSRQEAIALARTMRSGHLTDAEYRLVYEVILAGK